MNLEVVRSSWTQGFLNRMCPFQLQMRCEGYCGFSSVWILHILHLRFLKETLFMTCDDISWPLWPGRTFDFTRHAGSSQRLKKRGGPKGAAAFRKGRREKNEENSLPIYSNCTSLSFKMWCVLILNMSILRDSWASKWRKHRLQILHFGGSW